MSNYNDIFSKPYQGIDSFVSNVIKPTFGTSFFTKRNLQVTDLNQSERAIINSVAFFGEVALTAGDVLQCFDVVLKENVDISRNRVTIQSVVRKVMESYTAGLMVFHYPDNQGEWRISFVSKGKNVNDSTHAKRYTYLLGEGQPCRTVAERFATLQVITGERSIENIMEAFSVESLNKAFYSEIATWYYQFCGVDDEQPQYLTLPNANFALPSVKMDYQHFSIRLIGRLLFCWFLKHKKSKKGVPLVPNEILPNLTENKKLSSDFYHNTLEPLFFGCLNTPTNVRERYKMVELTGSWKLVPFLNGGLFSPQVKDYADDAFINTLKIDNDHLSELLRILSSYNFTIDESDPSDIELAVDPEMLGQIFENLLASISSETGSKDMRKKTGSYYTPKVIVDYMSTQSLLALLESKTQLDKTKLDPLFEDNGTHALTPKEVQLVSDTLFNMTILDPACGSGAFPMGVLGMALKVLAKIDPKGEDWKNRLKARFQLNVEIPRYIHKLGLIANCIYGVDIQPFAVEVSKLRAFLSLIVDDTIDDNAENRGIRPLPNLDFKFVAANTLVSLSPQAHPSTNEPPPEDFFNLDIQLNLGLDGDQEAYNAFISEFETISEQYFSASNPTDKERYKNQMKEILSKKISSNYKFVENEMERLNNRILAHGRRIKKAEQDSIDRLKREMHLLDSYKNTFTYQTVDFFEPRFFFPRAKNGFDIVIGNPPYIKEYTHKDAFEVIKKQSPYYQGKMDLWYAFTCVGIDLLAENGHLCFIATNNWTTNAGATIMRNKIVNDTQIKQLIDFGSYMVFKTASIQTMILLTQKNKFNQEYSFDCRNLLKKQPKTEDLLDVLDKKNTEGIECFEPNLTRKIFKNEFLVFSNQGNEILEKIQNQKMLKLDKKEVAQGIVFPQDFLNGENQKNLGGLTQKGDGIFVLSQQELLNIKPNSKELSLIKPYYMTDKIKQYISTPFNYLWCIFTDSSFKNPNSMDDCPNLKRHLDRFKDVITSDNKPYGLHRARDEYFFKGEKIIALRKCVGTPIFSYADFDTYVSATFYLIKTDRLNMKYLLGVLNSKLVAFWLKNKGKMQGQNYQLDKEPLLNIPIAPANKAQSSLLSKKS